MRGKMRKSKEECLRGTSEEPRARRKRKEGFSSRKTEGEKMRILNRENRDFSSRGTSREGG